MFVRGFNSRQVPLFIDGIPVYVPYDGNIDLARFTSFDIAEVSVTKGFTSVLYGANSLGGSINVVSRRPQASFEGEAGGGVSFDADGDRMSHRFYFNAGTNQDLWYAQIGGSLLERDHFLLPDGFAPTPTEDGARRENAAADDRKISIKLGLTPNATDELAIAYYNQQGEKETPPYAGTVPGERARFWRWPEYDKESLYLIGRKSFGEDWYVRLRAYYDKFDNTLRSFDDDAYTTQLRPFAFNSVYDDYSWGTSVELGTSLFTRHDLRAAFHYKEDVHRETDDDDAPEERFEDRTMSLGVEDRVTFGDAFTFIAGMSYDSLKGRQADNRVGDTITQFDLASESAFNIQGGVLYDLSEGSTARISVARRTRFPTIKDRYSFRFGFAVPNADLAPESAVNFELGIDSVRDIASLGARVTWGAALFYSEITDAIENVTVDSPLCSPSPCSQLQNIGEQTNRGFEALVTVDFGARWEWHVNYTYLDRKNDALADLPPLDIPEHSMFGYLKFSPNEAIDLVVNGEYGSERFAIARTGGVREAEGFYRADIKGIWRPTPRTQLEAGVRNVSDRLYAYEEGFPEPGRNYFLTARFTY